MDVLLCAWLTVVLLAAGRDTEKNRKWANKVIMDDPKRGVRIRRGTLAFAGSGDNSRATQLFVALSDKTWPGLGREAWESPIGYLTRLDMDVFSQVSL
jgi:hypothetical protein